MAQETKIIGKVSVTPKGTWNATNTYSILDIVSYDGSSYIAKQNVPANIALTNENYWLTVASRGYKGADGVNGTVGPQGPEGRQGATGPQGPSGEAASAESIAAWLSQHVQAGDTVVDNTLTIAGAAADAAVAGTGIRNLMKHEIHTTCTMNNNSIVYSNTGVIGSAEGYRSTGKIKIPLGVKKIFFPNMYLNKAASAAGWATYSSNQGYAQESYIRGGKTAYIEVNENDVYFAACGITNDAVWNIYYETANNYIDEIIEQQIEIAGPRYIDRSSGAINSAPNSDYKSSVKIYIPFGCKLITFPAAKPQLHSGTGWATYYSNGGSYSYLTYVRGGISSFIIPNDDDKYFAFTVYKNNEQSMPSSIPVKFYFGAAADTFMQTNPLYSKSIAFIGDSVTFGYDDDNSGAQLSNTWVKQVSNILGVQAYNLGISGATVAHRSTGFCWIDSYSSTQALMDGYQDIVGIMIGVNDCYNRSQISLGDMNSRDTSTFYGALHEFCKAMLAKFPPKNGKRIFLMTYPSVYSDAPTLWAPYQEAIITVAKYYAIPVLNLTETCGISPHADTSHEYWRGNSSDPAYYSPHLTQLGTNVVAPVIANYIKSNFS